MTPVVLATIIDADTGNILADTKEFDMTLEPKRPWDDSRVNVDYYTIQLRYARAVPKEGEMWL